MSSRRGADELISEGRVKVNNRIVEKLGTVIDDVKDQVKVGRRVIRKKASGLKLFHKPKNVITSLSDPEGRPCVADFLKRQDEGYVPVGRLDFDSTGLVVLTNDGELASRLMHPKYGFEKRYRVRVSGIVTEKILRRIRRGVRLSDGIVRGEVDIEKTLSDSTWLFISLTSGRNRIIRRLMKHLRHPVSKLHRLSHGPFTLGKIKVGEVANLPQERYEQFRERIMAQEGGKGRRKVTSTRRATKRASKIRKKRSSKKQDISRKTSRKSSKNTSSKPTNRSRKKFQSKKR